MSKIVVTPMHEEMHDGLKHEHLHHSKKHEFSKSETTDGDIREAEGKGKKAEHAVGGKGRSGKHHPDEANEKYRY